MADAARATFQRRRTVVPQHAPIARTDDFSNDTQKKKQWVAFLNKSNLKHEARELPEVINVLKSFLLPLLKAAREERPFIETWDTENGWH